MESFERLLVNADAGVGRVRDSLMHHVGRIIALLAILFVSIFMFTEIAFVDFEAEQLTLEATVIAVCGVIVYLSLESEGEAYAKGQESFRKSKEEADALAARVKGEHIGALREYLLAMYGEELASRQRRMLTAYSLTAEDLQAYQRGERLGKKSRYLKRVAKAPSRPITPGEILFFDAGTRQGEITAAPSFMQRFGGICKLIPSILCTLLTVGVMIEWKDGFCISLVIEGALRLIALVSMGLRGYLSGVHYVNGVLLPFHKVRVKLLDAFLARV